ncbi:transporter substrate-binding domain-containing protein [Shewanella sp. FJAT-51649]|uniref:substrate-binding periplasmic protein n=1 Tax=Shewanella sp. FJAT-51649 TaxID=2864210 RepID=UPI001C65BDEF|nr:transporter substrate-binding domain-containing protein [Shewanella sp. FJAT-51649]QYJ73218.1 transporter substrate-binding domain-containing protein [Shewanella sp. FJAT-51649]
MLRHTLFGLAIMLASSANHAQTSDEVLLYFTGRPPFIWQDEQGVIHGISYEIGNQVFTLANIPFRWIRAPSLRVQKYFEEDQEPLCLVNWINTKERSELGRVSLPTYLEGDYVAVMPKENTERFKHHALSQILQDKTVTVLIKGGYAYSTVLMDLFINMQAKAIDLRGDQQHNLMLLAEKRADIGFFEQQELELFIKTNPLLTEKVAIIRYDEINASPTMRHIICSKSVTEEQMLRINAAIKELKLPH